MKFFSRVISSEIIYSQHAKLRRHFQDENRHKIWSRPARRGCPNNRSFHKKQYEIIDRFK